MITGSSSDEELKGIINRKVKLSVEAKNAIGWAFVNRNSRLHDEAKTRSGDEANDAFLDAFKNTPKRYKSNPIFTKRSKTGFTYLHAKDALLSEGKAQAKLTKQITNIPKRLKSNPMIT